MLYNHVGECQSRVDVFRSFFADSAHFADDMVITHQFDRVKINYNRLRIFKGISLDRG